MATSGSFNTNAYDGRYLRFSWSLASQSVAQNKSVINWNLKGDGGSQYNWYLSGNFKVVINGATVYSSATRIKLFNGTTVASGQFSIPHNNDGSKNFSVSAEGGIYYVAVNCRGNDSWWLPTIARATQPTTNKSTMYFGENITINLPRASSSFTHTIQAGVDYGINFHDIATHVGTSYTWTLPKSWASYINNADKRLRIRALTYSDGTHVGTKEVSPQITVKATNDMEPVVNIALSDDNGHLATYGAFVRGQSKIRAKVTQTLYRDTSVKSRSLTLDGITYQTSEQVSNVITSTSQTVSATVTDMRNMTGTKTLTPTVYDWKAPKLTEIRMNRCNQNGTLDDTDNYIRVDYKVEISPINNQNQKNLKIGYKKQGASNWSYKTINLKSYTKTGFEVIPAGGEYSWDISVIASDDFNTITVNDVVGTVYVLMDYHKSGKGIAIGKVSELTETFEINKDWNVRVYGKLLKDYIKEFSKNMYPVGSIYMSVNSTNPSSLFGGTWVRWGAGRVPVGLDSSSTKFKNAEQTGGEYEVRLTANQMPQHSHSSGSLHTNDAGEHNHAHNLRKAQWGNGGSSRVMVDATSGYIPLNNTHTGWAGNHSHSMRGNTGDSGGNGYHNNIQPYVVCYMWKRTS